MGSVSKIRTTGAWLLLVLVIAIISISFTRAVPLYFRGDDAHYMKWASETDNPLSAFKQMTPHEMTYRPLNMFCWWLLFRMFGLQPAGYQACMMILYLLCLVTLYKAAESLYDRLTAGFVVLAYLVLFYYLSTVLFWFSDLTFLLEVSLMNLSVILLFRASKRDALYFPGILVFLMAALVKEPAALIVPACFIVYIFVTWKNLETPRARKSAILVASLLAAFAISSIMFHPKFSSTDMTGSQLLSLGAVIRNAGRSAGYYSGILLSKTGILIWVAVFYYLIAILLDRTDLSSSRRSIIKTVGSLILALVVAKFRVIALPVILLSGIVFLIKRRKELVAVAWAGIPLAGLLAVSVQVRTYLFEASMGLALLTGPALRAVAEGMVNGIVRIRSKRVKLAVVATGIVVILLGGFAGYRKVIRPKINAMRTVSAVRQNFSDLVKRAAMLELSEGSVLVTISYDDMGLDYYRDILPLGDREKARRQKVMDHQELAKLLELHGCFGVEVMDLGRASAMDIGGKRYIIVMNAAEQRFLEGLPMNKKIEFEVERRGEKASLYSISD